MKSAMRVINVDTRLLGYRQEARLSKSGLREYRFTNGLSLPLPSGLHGDIEILARKAEGVSVEELTGLDAKRKAGLYLREKLKGIPLDAFEERILSLLIAEDQDYHQRKKSSPSLKNIEQHGHKFRVQFKEGGTARKASFSSLEDAIRFRDRQYDKQA